ncbi:MAG TPA: hypothetical protein VGE31_02910 [Candidatus Paceibacterota bacterium]
MKIDKKLREGILAVLEKGTPLTFLELTHALTEESFQNKDYSPFIGAIRLVSKSLARYLLWEIVFFKASTEILWLSADELIQHERRPSPCQKRTEEYFFV